MFAPRFPIRFLLIVLLCGLSSRFAFGYVRLGPVWPNNSTAVIQLELGSTNPVLEDGFATWDASAADALVQWNPHMDAFQFDSVSGAATSQLSGDGFNSVFFSDSVFGEDFGEGVLAVTVLLFDISQGSISQEGDVVINQAYNYNSYRGPLKPGDPATRVYDIHRIFLHEFGHVLGLDHPDDFLQKVVAIMNSIISDLDALATDDMEGAFALYGLRITSPVELDVKLGDAVSFQVTTNANVSSYEATGLPPGITMNSQTGLIGGTAAATGEYDALVTVHGKRDVTGALLVKIDSADGIGDLREIFGFAVNRMVVDTIRQRIYASLPETDNVAVIDTVALTILKTIPTASEPSGLTMSIDGKTLFVAEKGASNPVIGVIDLDQLLAKPSLPAPFPSYDIAAGLDGQLFVTSWGHYVPEIAQIDATTGTLLAPFPSWLPFGRLQISPDRKTLYLGATGFTPPTLYAIDVTSDLPVVLQQTPFNRIMGTLVDLKLSHDGTTLCAADGGSGTLLKIPTHDLTTTSGQYVLGHGGLTRGAICFSGNDQTMFITNQDYVTEGVDVFDGFSEQYLRSVLTDQFNPTEMVIDAAGRYLFAGSFEQPDLRIYSLGQAGFPQRVPKPKSLLNVSTRLNSQPGDDALIAGFIISGSVPKNIVIRGIGPSLPVEGALYDPSLTLYDADGKVIEYNDAWASNRAKVLLSTLDPSDMNESAIVATLFPGSYTAILRGVGDAPGVGLAEIYDITADSDSAIANLSTRGKVQTGDDVMIGGFIISADEATKVLIRAIGPSLAQSGLTDALQNPVLELHGANGDLIFKNDDWRTTQQADIIATTIPPTDDRESAIVATLQPGNYTAIVSGQNNTTGVALVEVYNLDSAASASK